MTDSSAGTGPESLAIVKYDQSGRPLQKNGEPCYWCGQSVGGRCRKHYREHSPGNEAGKIPGSPEPELDLSGTTDDELADYLVAVFQTIRAALPYIKELRKRFAALPRGQANISGCATWEEFCTKKLHRTPSAIRKALAEARSEPLPDGQPEPESRIQETKLLEARIAALAKPLAPHVTAETSLQGGKHSGTFKLTTSFSSQQDLERFIKRVRLTYPESGTERQSLVKQVSEELFTPDPETRRTRFERFVAQLEKSLFVDNTPAAKSADGEAA
jgi:hypothetical protein